MTESPKPIFVFRIRSRYRLRNRSRNRLRYRSRIRSRKQPSAISLQSSVFSQKRIAVRRLLPALI